MVGLFGHKLYLSIQIFPIILQNLTSEKKTKELQELILFLWTTDSSVDILTVNQILKYKRPWPRLSGLGRNWSEWRNETERWMPNANTCGWLSPTVWAYFVNYAFLLLETWLFFPLSYSSSLSLPGSSWKSTCICPHALGLGMSLLHLEGQSLWLRKAQRRRERTKRPDQLRRQFA